MHKIESSRPVRNSRQVRSGTPQNRGSTRRSSARPAPVIAYANPENFKPSIRPVPSPLWYENLRKRLGQHRWTKLRKAIIAERGLSCEVCGVKLTQTKDAKAHEVWTYTHRGEKGIAKLERIELVCWFCHSCEHFALTQSLVAQGVLTEQAIWDTVAHFCKLNGTTDQQFECCRTAVMSEWQKLSAKRWRIDWGVFEPLLAAKVAGERMSIPEQVLR